MCHDVIPTLHSSRVPALRPGFQPVFPLRNRELSGPPKAQRYYQRPKASKDQNPGFPFRSPPLAKELVTVGRHNVVFLFFLTDLCIYLDLISQKCLRWLQLRYQDLYFLSPHSLLLGGSPDGLTYHSQARTEQSCSSGTNAEAGAKGWGKTRSITLAIRPSRHYVANADKSELQAREPGQVGGRPMHVSPGTLAPY